MTFEAISGQSTVSKTIPIAILVSVVGLLVVNDVIFFSLRGSGITQFVNRADETSKFESRVNKAIDQRMLNITQDVNHQEHRLNKKAQDSIADLALTARKRSTNLDVDVALLNRDTKKIENLKRIAEELQKNTESIKKALQKYGRRANGENVKDDEDDEPANESPKRI